MLNIIKKELKHSLRNRRALLLFILFPLILMWILSTVFAGQFSSSTLNYEGVSVLYTIDTESHLYEGFNEFTAVLNEMNINFVKINNKEEAIKQIENNNYVCYIELSEQNKAVTMFKNNTKGTTTSSFIESVLATFVQEFNLRYEIGKINPSALANLNSENLNHVNIVSLKGENEIRSIDYFGITMLTLIIMYSINTGLGSITREQTLKTGDRIIETPLPKYKLFLGKVVGCFIVTILQMILVISFSIFALGVNYGNDVITVFCIIMSEIFMCISLGIGIALIVKKEEIGNGLISLGVPLMVFLGGGYFPIDDFGGKTLATIAKLSPVKWVNESIFNIIHLQQYHTVATTLTINLSIALIMLVLSSRSFSKWEEL